MTYWIPNYAASSVFRPVGSRNHATVQNIITQGMETAGWTVTKDKFRNWIPYRGTKAFTNIIATLNPLAPYKMVLACHYDSKVNPSFSTLPRRA